jgi:heparinase II/III-like protein
VEVIRRTFCACFLLFLFVLPLQGYELKREALLSGEAMAQEALAGILRPREAWRPFPVAGQRESWTALPQEARACHIAKGERALADGIPALPATLYLEYIRTGSLQNHKKAYIARRKNLCDLVIAECIEGRGRFLDAIMDLVWAICEESSWCTPEHTTMQTGGLDLPDMTEPIVDLRAATTGAYLAWTSYLLAEPLKDISPKIGKRISYELQQRIIRPCLERDYHWMGFDTTAVRAPNNWNTWCNSNVLTVALLAERDEKRRATLVGKVLSSLDRYLGSYPEGGGCDEGPHYWDYGPGRVFDCLELLESATDGAVNIYDAPLIKKMGQYLCKVHIDGNFFINIGDTGGWHKLSGDLEYRYGIKTGDNDLAALGAWAAGKKYEQSSCASGSMGRQLEALFGMEQIRDAIGKNSRPPLMRDMWLASPAVQMMAARSRRGSSDGFYLAAWGAHNGQSHNHNDVGNFIVFADGLPVLIDPGIEPYTIKTFGPERYSIWTMQSAFHNLPTINGVMQKNGRSYAARNVEYVSDESAAGLSMDISSAYPPGAGAQSWVRTVSLQRGVAVYLKDEFVLSERSGSCQLNLVTPCAVSEQGPGVIKLVSSNGGKPVAMFLHYDPEVLKVVELENIPIQDHREPRFSMRSIWGTEQLTRIVLEDITDKTWGSWELQLTR